MTPAAMMPTTIALTVLLSLLAALLGVALVVLIVTRARLDGHDDREAWARVEHVEQLRERSERSVRETARLMEEIDRLGRGGD